MNNMFNRSGEEIRDDLYYYTNQIVNVVMIGEPTDTDWVLVDTGMPKCGAEILAIAEERFGEKTKPAAIILTHGHFDHIGGLAYLIKKWDVPVYAHPLEFPYLFGEKNYFDPVIEEECFAKLTSIYPVESLDIGAVLKPLPADGSIPELPDWRWIHTPGHSPGQIALFRDHDWSLLAADAFVTVRHDSCYRVLIRKIEINGPPRYLTTDWQSAWDSVKKLDALEPELVIPGHGTAMEGVKLRSSLRNLAEHFDLEALPS